MTYFNYMGMSLNLGRMYVTFQEPVTKGANLPGMVGVKGLNEKTTKFKPCTHVMALDRMVDIPATNLSTQILSHSNLSRPLRLHNTEWSLYKECTCSHVLPRALM